MSTWHWLPVAFAAFMLSSVTALSVVVMIDPAIAYFWSWGAWTHGRQRVEVIA